MSIKALSHVLSPIPSNSATSLAQVSNVSNLLYRGFSFRTSCMLSDVFGPGDDLPTASRRYSRLETCATIRALLFLCVWISAGWSACAAEHSSQQPDLAFKVSGDGAIEFNTGVLRGRLGADGKPRGLNSVVHIPTGMRLDASMGLFSHYRAFTVGKRYGTGAWDWPGKVSVQPDGSAIIRWADQPDRPFTMEAVYRWTSPTALELETVVHARTNLVCFEAFLASYFSSAFTNSLVYARRDGKRGLVAAMPANGDWQVFPRDAKSLEIVQDGRWKLEPHPVDWRVIADLAAPVGIRRAPHNGLAVLLSSSPEDCFAVCTPHQVESHYSMYLSLFGRDIVAGETARAKTTLTITGRLTEEELKNNARKIINHLRSRTRQE